MFNLLPQDLRSKIIVEYRYRLVIVIILFVILSQVSFLVFLFPTWLTSFYKERDFSIKSDEASRTLLTLDISSTTSYIKSLNSTLEVINKTLEYPRFIPIVDDIIENKTSGIKLDGIYYSVDSNNTGTITLGGIADKRETLVSFAESLRGINYFKKVDLPISNLAKDKNIDFNIKISIEK